MTAAEILDELKKIPPSERLGILETALRLTREEMQQSNQPLGAPEEQPYLALASKLILPKHQPTSDLREATTVDSEEFYDWGKKSE